MDIQTRKITFVQEFLRLHNEDVISGLEKVLQNWRTKSYEENLRPMTLEKFNKEIDQALLDSEHDKVIKATELKSKIEQWG